MDLWNFIDISVCRAIFSLTQILFIVFFFISQYNAAYYDMP